VEIVISETGWPFAGGMPISMDNVRTCYTNLVAHVKGGTPKKPSKPIETYLFAMFNENDKNADYDKFWGLFLPNKTPKYSFNFN
jgi:exo-beta-1,3-glucanase (GH17 family)